MMRRMTVMCMQTMQLRCVGLLVLMAAMSMFKANADELPDAAPIMAISITQAGCMSKKSGFPSFREQFQCIAGALAADPINHSDPYLQFYLGAGERILD